MKIDKLQQKNREMEKELLRLQKRNKELEKKAVDLETTLGEYISKEDSILSSLIETYSLSPETTLETLSTSIGNLLSSSSCGLNSSFNSTNDNSNNYYSPTTTRTISSNVSYSSSDSQIVELKKEILRLRQENQKLQQENEHFGHQYNSLKSKYEFLKSESRKNFNNPKNVSLASQAQIEELQKLVADSSNKIKKQREKIRNLNNAYSVASAALRDSQSSRDELIAQNQELRQKLNSITTDKSQINSNIQPSYVENQLKLLMPQIIEQVSLSSNDLQKECEIRDKIVNLLYKQIAMVDTLTDRLERSEQQINELEHEIRAKEQILQNIEKSNKKQNNSQDMIISELVNQVSISNLQNTEIKQINEIFNSQGKAFDKLNKAFRIVIDQIKPELPQNTDNYHQVPNSELLFYLKSINKFVRSFLESNNVQECIIGHQIQSNIKATLIQDSKIIDKYIMDNAKSLIEDTPIYNSLFNSLDPVNLQGALLDYLENVDDKNISSAVEAACTSNMILRKYSECMKEQCQILGDELQKMKRQVSKLSVDSSTNEQLLNDSQSYYQKSQQENQELTSKLERMNNMIDKCLDLGATLPNALLMLRNGQDFDENNLNETDYIESTHANSKLVEERVNQQISAYQARSDKKIKKLMIALKKCSTELSQTKEDNDKKQEAISDLEDTVFDLNSRLEKLSKDTDEELSNANEILEKTKENYEQQINKLNSEYENQINEINNLLIQTQKANDDELNDITHSYEKQIKALKADLAQHDTESESIRRRYEPIVEELNDKLSQTIQSELSLKSQVKELQAKLSNAQNQITNFELSAKLNEVKHRDDIERIKRETSLNNSKLQAQILAVEDKHKSEMEKIKSLHEIEKIKLLENAAKPFASTMGMEGMDDNVILNAAAKEVENYRKLSGQFSSAITEISELRTLLNLSSDKSAKEAVSEIINRAKEVEAQNQALSQLNSESHTAVITARVLKDSDKRLKDWESWARKLFFVVNDSPATTKSVGEVRRSLEEALIASSTDRQTINKLSSLRTQKSLLIQGCLNKAKRKYNGSDWTPLIALSVFIRRVERLSGNISTPLTVPKNDIREKNWAIVSTN